MIRGLFSRQFSWMKAATYVSLSGVALGSMVVGISPALAQRATTFELNRAICANDWNTAVNVSGRLIAEDGITPADRQSLMTLRAQLEEYRAEGVILANSQACDRIDPYFLADVTPSTVQTGEPLGWEGAVAEATENRYSTELITESQQLTLPVHLGSQLGLENAEPIDLSRGLTVVPGHVGAGHNVYGFVARLGDRLTLDVDVTQVMTGSLYTSDDSQLFVFDRDGRLLMSADDESATEDVHTSRISDLVIPQTGLYFAVVTSYNNDPIFNQDGRLAGWRDNGGGRFDYTLSLSGATPTSALVR